MSRAVFLTEAELRFYAHQLYDVRQVLEFAQRAVTAGASPPLPTDLAREVADRAVELLTAVDLMRVVCAVFADQGGLVFNPPDGLTLGEAVHRIAQGMDPDTHAAESGDAVG